MPVEIFRSGAGRDAYLAAYDALVGEWPVRPQSRFVEGRFGTTHVLVAGRPDRPPLLLLPAVSVSAASWFANVGDLSAHFHLFAVDTPGDAGKSRAARPLARSDFADWLDELVGVLHLDTPAAAGHSFGGWLAMVAAARRSGLFRRLALISPAAGLAPFRLPIRLALRLASLLPFRPDARRTLALQAAKGFVLNEAFVRLMDVVSRQCWPRVPFPDVLGDEDLAAIGTPTLVMIGDCEPLYDPAVALARAAKLIPGARCQSIAGAGHLVIMEKPSEVDSHLVRFLTGDGPA